MTVPNFYAEKAKRSFLNVFGDDPSVIYADNKGEHVEVYLVSIGDMIFPAHIDGVPFIYVEAQPQEGAA